MKKLKDEIRNALHNLYSPKEIQAIQRQFITNWLVISDLDYYCDKDTHLSIKQREEFNEILRRLKDEEPIQYILGFTYFCGLRLWVNQNVLIPRPETEELVKLIEKDISHCKMDSKSLKILDIGTGSGAIIIALATSFPQAHFFAIDVSESALSIAKRNALSNNVNIDFHKIDILENKYNEDISDNLTKLDIIVSNPPYICNSQMTHLDNNVINYEPHLALFVKDEDALIFYRNIAEYGQNVLKRGGKLFFEINQEYGFETKKLLEDMGYQNVCLIKDIYNNNRMIIAQNN